MSKNLAGNIEEIENELKSIIVDIARCRPNRIKKNTRVREDLGVDSFTALEVLVAVENRFKLKIAESELDKFITFEDVASYIFNHVSSGNKRGRSG